MKKTKYEVITITEETPIQQNGETIILEKGDKIKVLPPKKEAGASAKDFLRVTSILQKHLDREKRKFPGIYGVEELHASNYVHQEGSGRILISAEGDNSELFASYYEEFGMEQINSDFERMMNKAGFNLEWEDPGTLIAYRDPFRY